ncbi:Integrase core domain [Providencia stuartii]|nr:Integrase core domain [Providencia stuartii]
MAFVSDQLSNGRCFRVLNVVDDYSREMVGQLVSVAISGRQVARSLDQLMEERSKPNKVTCDNGTEFTSKAMFFWSKETGITLGFIQPENPTQNAFVESLNGEFRNKCLNPHGFRTLDEARYEIELWREHYNHVRPHSSLNDMPPVAYAKQVTSQAYSRLGYIYQEGIGVKRNLGISGQYFIQANVANTLNSLKGNKFDCDI